MSTTQQTVQQTVHGLHNAATKVRDGLSARRSARQAHRQLERELATYRTHSERNDLFMAANRYDGADAEQIRAILARQMAA